MTRLIAAFGQEESRELRIAALGQVAREGAALLGPQGLLHRQAAFEAGDPEAAVPNITHVVDAIGYMTIGHDDSTLTFFIRAIDFGGRHHT
jgi:hypothetical protein